MSLRKITLIINSLKKLNAFCKPSINPKMPSDTNLGWFFSATFAMIGLYSYSQQLKTFGGIASIVSFLFLAVTLVAPKVLSPLNRAWYELGMLLGKIVSPIVLGAIFFLMITPISLITRLFGRDELKIKKLSVQSYWVDRSPPGPSSDSFKNQF